MPDFSQLFCNFWGRILAWCAGKHKCLKIYGDYRTAETSHYKSGKQYFRSIIIRGVWRVKQKVIGNALRSLFSFLLLSDVTYVTN